MLERFSRTELLFGKEAMEKLASSHVAVFGLGGVGGYTAEALVRTGIGAIDIVDNDRVCLSNLNRQIYATMKTVGQYKVDVAEERIHDINPDVTVRAYKIFFTPETADIFDFSEYDYVIDAIDTVTGKIALAVNCSSSSTPIISSMGAGNKVDPTAFEVTDIYKTSVCPLAKVMRRELKLRGIKKLKVVYSKEPPITPLNDTAEAFDKNCLCPSDGTEKCTRHKQTPGSNAFVPSVVGLIIAGEVIKDLTGYKNPNV